MLDEVIIINILMGLNELQGQSRTISSTLSTQSTVASSSPPLRLRLRDGGTPPNTGWK